MDEYTRWAYTLAARLVYDTTDPYTRARVGDLNALILAAFNSTVHSHLQSWIDMNGAAAAATISGNTGVDHSFAEWIVAAVLHADAYTDTPVSMQHVVEAGTLAANLYARHTQAG